MSAADTLIPILSTHWTDADGNSAPVRCLPGLRTEVIKTLASAYPRIFNPALEKLLERSCGLADTDLGLVDFSGCSHPDEPHDVFQPCLTLAVDDSGRRWIAECGGADLPGPIWCVFPDPAVAVYVCEDLPAFIAMLWRHTRDNQIIDWLKELSATAHSIWACRRALALRPHQVLRVDEQIRGWLSTLPTDAYIYDLRGQHTLRAWPYGIAGPSGRLFRCARLLVFAAAGPPANGWRTGHPPQTTPRDSMAAVGLELRPTRAPIRRRRPQTTAPSAAAWPLPERAQQRLRHRSSGAGRRQLPGVWASRP